MILKSYEIQRNPSNFLKYNVFLLYGENSGLKKDIRESIKTVVSQQDANIELLSLYENDIIDNEENFYNSIYSGSLFSNKKIITINNGTDKIIKQLNDIVDKNPENVFIIRSKRGSNMNTCQHLEFYNFKNKWAQLDQDSYGELVYVVTLKDQANNENISEFKYQLQSSNDAAFSNFFNYPNPFSNQTTLQYDVAEATSVKIYIYNTLGQLVKTIDQGENGVGTYTVEWDGKNDDGDTLSSGVYFYQLRTKDFNKTMKMLLVK